jgi:pimeloyl-ACP methyl ester carboxylesterase
LLVRTRLLAAVFATLAFAGCARTQATRAIDHLKPCTGYDVPVDAYCGTLKVFENRATKQGRQIDLSIVVLPALSNDPKPDPFFFLAGGPGQGAAKMAKPIRELFRQIVTERDIVLVDQRGTGKSNPLDCIDPDDSLKAFFATESMLEERLRSCMKGYDADLRLYTTDIAMDDLDDVRAFLGYETINIYGGSYGTRAGLVYMRRHGDRVRAAVLDGVAPTNMRLPLYFARDAQQALDKLIADCAADGSCNAAYPNLGARVRALLERLEKNPPVVQVVHPRTGERGEIRMTARIVANVMVSTLYQPLAASLIPALIARAEENDFQGLLALGAQGDPSDPNMSIGMQLSVICAEDWPKLTPEELKHEAEGSLFGPYIMRIQQGGCGFWPRGEVEPSFYEPVQSSIPTLILSGAIDPVTPPVWGESIAKTLTNSRHLVFPGTGHTAGGTGCGRRLIKAFIDAGTPANLDTSCVQSITRPPYFVTPSGPNPTTGKPPAGGPAAGRPLVDKPTAGAAR